MNLKCIAATLILVGTGMAVVSSAVADPLPGTFLKFYQMPLNNGATPYLVPLPPTHPPIAPPAPPYGSVPSTAIFPGHDELSTAYRTAPDPFAPYQGTYMADDFADYAGTPITHVRWWGSYMNPLLQGQVKKFLISFEHNVPEFTDPATGAITPSHPDFHHPDNLHQIVDLVPGLAPPLPGTFTEKPLLTPVDPGMIPPREPLFEYNAELNLGKWFNEKAASSRVLDDVYWLKIVALVDVQQDGQLQWGWHNRDWSIKDELAAVPGDTPDGAERIIGFVPGIGGAPQPVWHFEDDAVQGNILVHLNPTMPHMPNEVLQTGHEPQSYILPWDLPTNTTQQFSKDLAFELYTNVPEPCTLGLMAIAVIAFTVTRRRH